MGFKRSLHKEVYVIKTTCDECDREYLCLGVGDDYEPICPHCGYNDDRDAEVLFSYELQPDGELIDVRKLVKKPRKNSDPEFCTRCQNLILDCECGDEDFEAWYAENHTEEDEEPEDEEEEEPEVDDEEEDEESIQPKKTNGRRRGRWAGV